MALLFDACSTLISLIFLGIVGLIAGVAIPGLFMAAAAPWLDWGLPFKKKERVPRSARAPGAGPPRSERVARRRASRPRGEFSRRAPPVRPGRRRNPRDEPGGIGMARREARSPPVGARPPRPGSLSDSARAGRRRWFARRTRAAWRGWRGWR